METTSDNHLRIMKRVRVTIPNPCHENWQEMTPQSNGRHCFSCDTVVRDYANLSDTQLQHVLQQIEGPACGHFRKDQLNRNIRIAKEKRGPDLLAVVLGLSLLVTALPSYADNSQYQNAPISLIELLKDDVPSLYDGHEHIRIKMYVHDKETYEPLLGAKVVLRDSNDVILAGAISDFDGYATLLLSPDIMDAGVEVSFEHIGYVKVTLEWSKDWQSGHVQNVAMNAEEYLIDGMMIIDPVFGD